MSSDEINLNLLAYVIVGDDIVLHHFWNQKLGQNSDSSMTSARDAKTKGKKSFETKKLGQNSVSSREKNHQ